LPKRLHVNASSGGQAMHALTLNPDHQIWADHFGYRLASNGNIQQLVGRTLKRLATCQETPYEAPACELEKFRMMFLKRLFDVIVSACAVLVLAIPMAIVAIAVRVTSPGRALYWSKRIGKDNRIFMMPKFRTMRADTPVVATHLLNDPSRHLTPIGGFLRKSSLDELPQLWCILKGEMSLVGPRPALFNQDDLIEARTNAGVHTLLPGLTGWAQVNGRDELAIPDKVALDAEYGRRRTFVFDLHILTITAMRVIRARGVSH
jgi:O-antigen biosynthesis protein WbqP